MEEKELVEGAAEGIDLHEKYTNKTIEMQDKYHDAIVAIAEKHGVDMGVAFDMLKATCRGADYADGIEFDRDELKADYLELAGISDEIVKTGI